MSSRLYALSLTALLGSGLAIAQEFRSTISGVVTDPAGAAIPGVEVTGTQIETGAKYKTVTTADGNYTLTPLPPGTYSLDVTAAGFKRLTQTGIQVSANQRIGINLHLQLGAVSEKVDVQADAPMLDTVTASSGQVINTRQIEDIPLNGRSPIMAAGLAGGVIQTSVNSAGIHAYDNGGESGFAMGGAGSQQNEIMVDGSEDTRQNGQVAYAPPVDAVQEVR